jgi:hypothetical protein
MMNADRLERIANTIRDLQIFQDRYYIFKQDFVYELGIDGYIAMDNNFKFVFYPAQDGE